MFHREQPPVGHGELPPSFFKYALLGQYWTRKSNISSSRGQCISASAVSAPTVSPPRSLNENSKKKPSRTSTPTNRSSASPVATSIERSRSKPPHWLRISVPSRARDIVDHAWPNLSSPPAYVVSPAQPSKPQRESVDEHGSSSPPHLYCESGLCWRYHARYIQPANAVYMPATVVAAVFLCSSGAGVFGSAGSLLAG